MCFCRPVPHDAWVQVRLGCNSELILDEFGEKLLEELDYQQEARNIQARADTSCWGLGFLALTLKFPCTS